MGSTNKHGKAAGIRDIAEAMGTSIGTVDRALHGRGGVSARTKVRILRMAEQLGYKPNIAARSLKLNRNVRIAAVFPARFAHRDRPHLIRPIQQVRRIDRPV